MGELDYSGLENTITGLLKIGKGLFDRIKLRSIDSIAMGSDTPGLKIQKSHPTEIGNETLKFGGGRVMNWSCMS